MDTALLLKALAAFALVVSLMLAFSWFLKRIGLSETSVLRGNGKRRLKVVEHLALDHRRRLVLVRCDAKEHLLVLGPGGETVVESGLPAIDDNVIDLAAQKGQKNA